MIAVIQSLWNRSITDALAQAAVDFLHRSGFDSKLVQVPGALEIPLAAKALIQKHPQIQGVVAVGCIIRGETYHFELVAQESSRMLSELSMQSLIPIGQGILATYTLEQAQARASTLPASEQKLQNKGLEAAEAVVQMVNTLKSLSKD